MNIPSDFLESALRIFRQYRSLGERTLAQIPDEAWNHQFNPETNSISNIIKHLHGNMLSRWTDFLTTDGEKPWRERDGEFENLQPDKTQIMEWWHTGWDLTENTIAALKPEDLTKTVYIRSEAHSVMDAINRQTTHYAYHIGQIVYVAKIFVGEDWKTLTIPRKK
ncbi:MAG: DUF1572 family protein [Bacteroidetes bacterium]|nr:DUF1572 family protein [Bacteroidota bacterium]